MALPQERALIAALVLAGILQGGCTTPEPQIAPSRDLPASYRNASALLELPRPSGAWWRELSSRELDRLEEAALANNTDLQVAIARVAQANAQAAVAGAARRPTLDAVARREIQGPADGLGSAATSADWHSENRYQLGLRASYEVDLWGRLGYAAESALAAAKASEYQRQTVALTLTAEVAATYLELLSLDDRIRVTERSLQNRRNSFRAISRRMEKGDATALETAQQQVAVATAEATHASLVQRRERAFNRLAVLTGIAPSALRIEAKTLGSVEIPGVGAGVPAELVCRRPDIRRLEAQITAADLDVKSVRAALLPSLSLNGDLGYGSTTLASLLNPASALVVAAASVSQAVFDGGRREAQLELAKARQLETVHQYSGGLLTAVREVEDALAATRLTQTQHRALVEAVAAARAAYDASLKYYEVGAIDYFVVLDAEQKLVTNEDAAETALHDRVRAAVDLYRALGGGTLPGDEPCR